MQSTAKTVEEYLNGLEPERRKALSTIRDIILKNLSEGYEEVMQYGMISYIVPFSIFPKTYNNQPLAIASLASQKNHMAVYLMCVYGDESTKDWFVKEYQASGKKLDMGKSCIRFKKLEDLPVELIGKVIGRTSVKSFIAQYENAHKQIKK
ncbi:MAG: DUF1801 domain-containing protein [Candidatus Abawacabacteria bacterium]|nr:DUF1801 domain-containing protein [Candidatus Abawacabacteria bacterium]